MLDLARIPTLGQLPATINEQQFGKSGLVVR